MQNILFAATKLNTITPDCDPKQGSFSFFTLNPWYQYLQGKTDALGKCIPIVHDGTDIGLILLAIIDSLLKLAAIVAIGFIVYGGVQYVISQGEPEKTSGAYNTIVNALIGLVIAMVSASVVSFIGSKLK